MANVRSPRLGNDRWSLFLRQKHLQDQLRRLRNDFKGCYCPPRCRRGMQNHVTVDPTSLPGPMRPLHGPYVAADSGLPRTRARPEERRHPNIVVMAEARGTSDILLHRSRIRATLRMSLQVYEDPIPTGRRGYFGEMFLTRPGQEEQFIGFIHAWQMGRTSDDWIDLLLGEWGERFGDPLSDMRVFFSRLFARPDLDEQITADRNGNILPRPPLRQDFAAPWARLNDNTDVVYIQMIWLDDSVTGQRIIDQGFDLFYRLMAGGTLPEPYNLNGPLTILLEPGLLGSAYRSNWTSSINPGLEMTFSERIRTVGRAYERNGFLYLNQEEDEELMGRRVDPRDHPAAPGDVAIMPPDPPDTDLQTPTPERLKRGRIRSRSPESPLQDRTEGSSSSSSDSSASSTSSSSSSASTRRLLSRTFPSYQATAIIPYGFTHAQLLTLNCRLETWELAWRLGSRLEKEIARRGWLINLPGVLRDTGKPWRSNRTMESTMAALNKKAAETIYTPLEPGTIRLVHLHPASDLNADVGSQDDPREIRLNGTTVLVTQNLYKALRRLRLQHESRVIWVDALAINQSDIAERNVEVQVMRDIYSSAYETLAWLDKSLGEDGESRLSTWTEPGYCPSSRVKSRDPRETLSAIARQRYWSRIWTAQEAFLLTTGTLDFLGLSNLFDYTEAATLPSWDPELYFRGPYKASGELRCLPELLRLDHDRRWSQAIFTRVSKDLRTLHVKGNRVGKVTMAAAKMTDAAFGPEKHAFAFTFATMESLQVKVEEAERFSFAVRPLDGGNDTNLPEEIARVAEFLQSTNSEKAMIKDDILDIKARYRRKEALWGTTNLHIRQHFSVIRLEADVSVATGGEKARALFGLLWYTTAKPGDEVYLVRGCSRALLLRPEDRDPGKHKLIGSIFFPGPEGMEDPFIDELLTKPNSPATDIFIC
ncbi:hypothetical protein INS49_005041 [Diaporthe citri]|uniref:uncharacterized protein n=1 Tax=Diaporthe citri TaxID=83186 RepID=UPI001C7E4B9C|nr:uncharacterized protein INS49_005041 [Diaporthe citri]KAG6354070.1 hypothetical protein INS49_005041 [Diaporthe citri]